MSDLRTSHTFSEMARAARIVREFSPHHARKVLLPAPDIHSYNLHIVAEGSSRHFPAGNFMYHARRDVRASQWNLEAYGGREAVDIHHNKASIILISNSGNTRELLDLFDASPRQLQSNMSLITAGENSELARRIRSDKTVLLQCGTERGTAATMSVMEQAMTLQSLISEQPFAREAQEEAARFIGHEVMHTQLSPELIATIANASSIQIAGPHNGVAEELTLKFQETLGTRINAHTNTGIVHGPQRSLQEGDVAIVIEPSIADEAKLIETLEGARKAQIIAISSRTTPFPTIQIPRGQALGGYFQLAAGWGILLAVAQRLGVEANKFDNPEGVHKVGYGPQTPAR